MFKQTMKGTLTIAVVAATAILAGSRAYASEHDDWDSKGPWSWRGPSRDTRPRDTPDFAARCAEAGKMVLKVPRGEKLDSVTMVGSELRDAGTATEHCAVTFDFVTDSQQRWVHRATHILPRVWTGRFLQLGGGGWDPGYNPNANATYLAEGIAHATFDNALPIAGHELLWMDYDVNDSADRVFSRDGLHLSTVIGKQIIREIYERPAAYDYYIGCSTGGNMGAQAALYHPDTFDGIAHGAIADYGPALLVYGRIYQPQIRPGSGSELATPGPKLAALLAEVNARCDGLDGVMDNVIDRPEQCHIDAAELAASVGLNAVDTAALKYQLEDAQATLVAHTTKGTVRFKTFKLPPNNQLVGSGFVDQIFAPSFWGALDPTWDPANNGDATLWRPAFLAYDFYAQENIDQVGEWWASVYGGRYFRDLHEFGKRGGKLIVWHTWPDPFISIYSTIDWVKAMKRADPGNSEERYLRFYHKTTGGHCQGNWDEVQKALFNWVEKGKAADSLPLDEPASNRPACEYPLVPKLIDASSDKWSCIDTRKRNGHGSDWWREDRD